jgi:dinuclear metal center YbgI/SA1388 family protein
VASRDEIVQYANDLLGVSAWPEYGPAGLQVIGAAEVQRIACGVSASRELFERAVEQGAELVLVHHGLFWRNEPLVVDARLRGRLEALFRGNASLVAYHLPLDAHPELGNAARLASSIGAADEGDFGGLGRACVFDPPVALDELVARVGAAVGRDVLVMAHGPDPVRRLAVSTGGAGHELVRAAHEGFDGLLTGEPEEPSAATARELGVTLIAAGHHATERLGVQALARHLAERFGLEWSFVEVDNPV